MTRISSCLVFATLSLLVFHDVSGQELKPDHPDRNIQAGVPQGKLITGSFANSQIFPGTKRDYSVYIPSQYDGSQAAALMVFQDGASYAKSDGPFRVPIVFDNLIHQKAMPVTIAVFVGPGIIPPDREGAKERSNRSFEYDSLGDRYVRFLIDEFLPEALKELNISKRPEERAICGISSGGICAFTAAWERPDQFGRVLSHIGSFTDIRGGWAYPALIRKSKDKPKKIKVYLQEGKDDLNNLFGNWPLANEDMAAALRFAGYDYKFVMTDGGHSGIYGGDQLASALRWLWSDEPKQESVKQPETKPKWEPHPDAIERDDVPHGTVETMPPWESKIFARTIRNWSVYVPRQYTPDKPSALMIFQDGHSYESKKGQWRVPTVFDNLIARGDMPPTIAIFVDPGHDSSKSKPDSPWKSSNRSFEYDSLGDRYARFLLEEIIPEVEKKYAISKDPNNRAICGASSGGICSFTVAWERPDQFRKVLSTIGSFVNLRGGDAYPSLIRKTEPKPIRVYLADTSGDLDNPFGHWPTANKQMASSLTYMGYDVRFDWAEGYAHNADHGSALFPDALKWLWRSETHTPVVDTKDDLKGDLTILKLLKPDKNWELVVDGLGFADAACHDAEGNFYFSDMKAPAVFKIDAMSGTKTEIAKEAISGMKMGDDGLLYGCQGAKNRIISIEPTSGNVREIAKGVAPNCLALLDKWIYITETKQQQLTRIDRTTGESLIVDSGIEQPNGIARSTDGGTMAVSDSGTDIVWTFRIKADGSLDSKMPTMKLRLPIDPNGEFRFNEPPPYQKASLGDGMCVDKAGRYFVTSALGVQVFDPTGRLCGVLTKPHATKPLTSCSIAGKELRYLYVTHGDAIYRRELTIE